MTARKTLLVSCISLFAQLAHGQVVQQGVIRLRDSGIEYFSEGKGQPVVLLPGGSLTIGYMEGLSHTLAKAGFQAVRINFRSSGKSTGSGEGVTLHTR
jgi:predicted alpha/beta-fold hydrolase